MLKMKVDDREVKRALRKVQKNLNNTAPLLRKIGDDQIKEAQYRIRTSKTTPDGTPWRPWAYSTLQSRLRDGSASKGLLFKTGMLLNSFFKKVSRKTLTISNKAPYASYLQNGTSKMPSRPFLGWGKRSKSVETALVTYFKKVLK